MSYISDYKCGAIDKEEYDFFAARENREERDFGQFNIMPDTYLPLDCDGIFREEDCAYCIECDECRERKGGETD